MGCGTPESDRDASAEGAGVRELGVARANFDTSVRPRDDFFRFVNGTWLDNTEIPEDKSTYGSFAELADRAEADLRAIIEESAAEAAEPGSHARKIGDFYNSFLDADSIEALGLGPLQQELARVEAIGNLEDVIAYVGHSQTLGIPNPFAFYVNLDLRDSTRYLAYMTQAGLGLPDRDYYLKDEAKFAQTRQAYRAYIEQLFELAGFDSGAGAAATVLALESRLAEAHWTRVENRDRDATYNKYGLRDAADLTPEFDWPRFLESAGLGESEEFVIRQPSYFEALARALAEVPAADWQTYFRFKLVDHFAPYLAEPFVDAHFDFYSRTVRGIEENRPRWKRAVEATDTVLGDMVGELYVERHFRPEAKERMDGLVENLRAAFRESIDELEWMGEETRAEAQTKLEKFATKIGYPQQWKDYSGLEIRAGELVGNLLRSEEVEYQRMIDKLGGPVDRGEWLLTPQTVNAYYYPPLNEIVFPAAILRPPFFNVAADEAVNYGAIGAVIGHEFSHGFDDQGRKSDGDGNLRDWWTERDAEEFKRRAGGLVEQYNEYSPVEGMHVNGELTLGENIGDLAGLTLAYRAYQLSLGEEAAPEIDGFTGDQRFFLGWGQVWRRLYREEELIRRLSIDPHAPARYRVNGVLANMPEFYEAFGVTEADRLYRAPEDRVKIW